MCKRFFPRLALLTCAMVFLSPSFLGAAPSLVITIVNPNQIGAPGGVMDFQGTITNNVGFALSSTDLFLDFSAYDPVNVLLDQVLGATTFVIDDGTTSAVVDLFAFTLSNTAEVPASFPATVILEDSNGDLSTPADVTVNTITPEPAAWILMGLGLFALLGAKAWRQTRVLLGVMALLASGSKVEAQLSAVQLVSSEPGLAQRAATDPMMLALPITNNGTVTAANVAVTSLSLRNASLISPTVFPVVIGNMSRGSSAIFQANFTSSGLVQGTKYLLTVRGTYQVGGATGGFTVNRFVQPPITSPGSATTDTTTIASNLASGALYTAPPLNDDFDSKVNTTAPPVPVGPFVSGVPTPTPTTLQNIPNVSGQARANAGTTFGTPSFTTNKSLGLLTLVNSDGTGNAGFANSTAAEPSGDVSGSVVLNSTNSLMAFSTDSGGSFTSVVPSVVFSDDVGFCCDQIVKYVPSINEFVWLMQGDSGYRLAIATPDQLKSASGLVWRYWKLKPESFGQPEGTDLDYPALSIGDIYLYLAWNVGQASCPAGCTKGRQVVRVPLSDLQAGGSIHVVKAFTSDGGALFSNLSQDTGDTVYWASSTDTSVLRVFAWPETETSFSWLDVPISTWSPFGTLSAGSSSTPDGQDWLTKARSAPAFHITGAVRKGTDLWFAWTAGPGNGFSHVHVELVELRADRFLVQKVQQMQIWNDTYSFAYPTLAANCGGEIGISLEAGGGDKYENHAVGFVGENVLYLTTNSNVGTTRYGDYTTIRPNGLTGYFNAWGYGLSSGNGGAKNVDVHYVVFGHNLNCSTD